MTDYTDCGVIYVAAGEQFVEEARVSARSVLDLCPEITLTLFTDVDYSPPEFDSITQIDNPHYGFADKIENMLHSPHERTIYLDCDTYLCDEAGLYDLFDLLNQFDVAAAHDTARRAPADGSLQNAYTANVPTSFPMFNGGLLAYNSSPDVYSVLEDWLRRYQEQLAVDQSATDQEALRAALYDSDLRIATIPPEYNFRIPYPQPIYDEVKILHGRAENYEEIQASINSAFDGEPHFYIPAHVGAPGLTEEVETVKPLIDPGGIQLKSKRLRLALEKYGIVQTVCYLLLGGFPKGYLRQKQLSKSLSERGVRGTIMAILSWLKSGNFGNTT